MKTTLMTIVLSFLVVAGSALAQTGKAQNRPMPGWKNNMGAGGLKLSDQQKKDVQKIKFDLMQKQIDLHAKTAHARLDYEQLTSADSPDESAIAAKIDDIAKLQVQSKKNMLDGWFAVNKILTPDQQKIWKKVLQHPKRAANMMIMRMRANGRNGGNGMMQWRRPGIGGGQMMGGQMLGEGSDSNQGLDEMWGMGPMSDGNMFYMNDDPLSDDLDIFDMPMTGNWGTMGLDDLMGPSGNQMPMMQKMMNQSMPDMPAPDSSK